MYTCTQNEYVFSCVYSHEIFALYISMCVLFACIYAQVHVYTYTSYTYTLTHITCT